ncbi:uncharacterized protein DUF3150 [Geothermobacter ehrlichii]|uniref:Uncharacterized protein DUF3150 n=1 Tax=Geothermobacter ehrlichii TaxID=213224 RepID=A0A5D3WHF3_9BACT|nr:uncharacterized protein DUF3150 [Geothermobacter ehrlichii]
MSAVNPIRRIHEKARGLVFLEPGLADVLDAIEAELDALPSEGPLKGPDFFALVGILNTLASLDGINLHVEDGQEKEEIDPVQEEQESPSTVDVEDVFQPITGQRQAAVAPPVAWF